MSLSILCCLPLSFCACRPEVTVTSLHPPRLRRIAVLLVKPIVSLETSRSFEANNEDVESEVYCRRRSGNFWRMRASLGCLACAHAATLGTQVVGRRLPRAAARPRT